MQSVIFENERKDIVNAFLKLQDMSAEMLNGDDLKKIKIIMFDAVNKGMLNRGTFDLNPILFDIQTAIITTQEIGLSRASIISTLLHDCVALGCTTIDEVEKDFGKYTANFDEQYAIMLESDVPVVAQYGRAEPRVVNFYTTPGYCE